MLNQPLQDDVKYGYGILGVSEGTVRYKMTKKFAP